LHDGTHWVAETYRVVLFTEAGKHRLKDRPSPEWSVAALGLSRAVGDLAPLPYVKEELRGIVKQAGIEGGVLPGTVRLDDQFSRQEFGKALQEDKRVLHIASHFVFNPGTVVDSYLVLGDGQKLTLQEVRMQDVRFDGVELLTLSACETAVSETRPGSGRELEGFAMEAVRQGAKGILATLWPVADPSTCEFMRTFYRLHGEGQGLSKAEALQRAQLSFLQGTKATGKDAKRPTDRGVLTLEASTVPSQSAGQQPDSKYPYAHPYYWAPFVLTGNWL